MDTIAILSRPGGRRRIADPCLDAPVAIALKRGGTFSLAHFDERDLSGELSEIMRTGAADATPHISAGDKMALHSICTGKNLHFVWEGNAARSKRKLVHFESLAGVPARTSGGVPLTPAVIWGILGGDKFPGEEALLDDTSAAATHLDLLEKVAKSAGYGCDESTELYGGEVEAHPSRAEATPDTPTDAPDGAGEGPEIPPPGIGLGYFSWLREPIPGISAEGPAGRGWGRISEDKRPLYPKVAGRMDPGCNRIRGFVYATTDGHVVYNSDNEGEVILRAFRFLEIAKFSASLVVEDIKSFRTFTLGRAAHSGTILPSWLFFPHGRSWVADLSKFAPPLEAEPFKWLLREGVAQGLKTCSGPIAEPGTGFFPDDGHPGISAKSVLGAISRSPYFFTGGERAPELWRGAVLAEPEELAPV